MRKRKTLQRFTSLSTSNDCPTSSTLNIFLFLPNKMKIQRLRLGGKFSFPPHFSPSHTLASSHPQNFNGRWLIYLLFCCMIWLFDPQRRLTKFKHIFMCGLNVVLLFFWLFKFIFITTFLWIFSDVWFGQTWNYQNYRWIIRISGRISNGFWTFLTCYFIKHWPHLW